MIPLQSNIKLTKVPSTKISEIKNKESKPLRMEKSKSMKANKDLNARITYVKNLKDLEKLLEKSHLRRFSKFVNDEIPDSLYKVLSSSCYLMDIMFEEYYNTKRICKNSETRFLEDAEFIKALYKNYKNLSDDALERVKSGLKSKNVAEDLSENFTKESQKLLLKLIKNSYLNTNNSLNLLFSYTKGLVKKDAYSHYIKTLKDNLSIYKQDLALFLNSLPINKQTKIL